MYHEEVEFKLDSYNEGNRRETEEEIIRDLEKPLPSGIFLLKL